MKHEVITKNKKNNSTSFGNCIFLKNEIKMWVPGCFIEVACNTCKIWRKFSADLNPDSWLSHDGGRYHIETSLQNNAILAAGVNGVLAVSVPTSAQGWRS